MGKSKEKSQEESGSSQIETDRKITNRQELFEKYITPNLGLVYKVCREYTKDQKNYDDNCQEVLINFYKYIASYNPDQKIATWIYIVTKRYTISLEKGNAKHECTYLDKTQMDNMFNIDETGDDNEFDIDNFKERISDEVLEAIEDLPDIYRNTFLMKMCGFKLREIMDHEHENGNLKNKNLDTVKSRLFLARNILKNKLKEFNEQR